MNELKAVIQAGGRGTRLAPYSTVLPKALMPIGEGTVIDNLLAQFKHAGVGTVFITVSRFGPLIRSYCGNGDRWGLNIEYVTENHPLGTIGPLDNLRNQLNSSFFVANSDVFTDLDLDKVLRHHLAHPAPLTVVVTAQKVNISYGVLDHDKGRVTAFREKPSEEFSVSTGIYCMEPSVFDYIPAAQAFGFDQLMHALLASGTPVNIFQHTGRWVDIGRIEDLRRAQEEAAVALATESNGTQNR
jgi:NDP-sugar pyrophosphorylase family protein